MGTVSFTLNQDDQKREKEINFFILFLKFAFDSSIERNC